MNAPNNHCIRKCQKGVLQKYLELCYSTILKVELYCSTILKLIIFVYSHFLTLSLSLTLFLFSFLSPQRRLSLITSLFHDGLFWRGSWVWCGGETGRSDQRGVFLGTFSGFMGMRRRGMVVCGGVFMDFRCGL